MRRDQQRIVIVGRDRELLTRVFENRIMSAQQIRAEFFANVARQTFQDRLAKVTKYGLLERKMISSSDMGDFPAYSITPKALQIVRSRYPFPITKDFCKSDSIEHDIELVNIRNRLRSLRSVIGYFTENVLQACEDLPRTDQIAGFRKLNTDVALEVRKNGKDTIIGLEFERSEKSVDRYTKKLFSYYRDPSTAVVLYICRNAAIQKTLARAEASVMGADTPRCFYAQLEDVLRKNGKCTFKNLKEATITLE